MKLKICGMKYADNIKDVAKLSPDFMGFIFYPKSKRFVGEDFQMPEISSEIKKVGVFVNDLVENILSKVKKYKLDLVQLHGNESSDFCAQTSKVFKTFEAGHVEIIKAFGLPCHSEPSEESFSFSFLNAYESSCEYFLFDTKTKEYGGSGKTFDKSILMNYKLSKPFFLSGGIDLADIPYLTSHISHPFALDVNSRFEVEHGLKDISKL